MNTQSKYTPGRYYFAPHAGRDYIEKDGERIAFGEVCGVCNRRGEIVDALAEALRGLRDMILDSREFRSPDKAERMRNAAAALTAAGIE